VEQERARRQPGERGREARLLRLARAVRAVGRVEVRERALRRVRAGRGDEIVAQRVPAHARAGHARVDAEMPRRVAQRRPRPHVVGAVQRRGEAGAAGAREIARDQGRADQHRRVEARRAERLALGHRRHAVPPHGSGPERRERARDRDRA
jgi:hypothetical protein